LAYSLPIWSDDVDPPSTAAFVYDGWDRKRSDLDLALRYNRKLWSSSEEIAKRLDPKPSRWLKK